MATYEEKNGKGYFTSDGIYIVMDIPDGLSTLNRFCMPTYEEKGGKGVFNNGYSIVTFDVIGMHDYTVATYQDSPLRVTFNRKQREYTGYRVPTYNVTIRS